MRCFKINTSEIDDKLSVETYFSEYIAHYKIFSKCKYDVMNLGKLIYDIKDGAHKTPIYHEDGIKFVMSNNVKECGIDFKDVKYISKYQYYKLINSSPNCEDVLFTKVGAKFGIAAIVPNDHPVFTIFVSTSVLKDIDRTKILPEYLVIYLNSYFTRIQIDEMAKGIGVPDLHLEQIEKIKIIVPPKEIQKKIIEHWKCYEEKITRLKLRIETIENTFNKIIETNLNVSANRKQRKYFKIRTNDLRERSDVEFYTEAERIDNGQKKSIPLSRLCWNISSGQRPKGGVKYSEGLIPNFGGEHITQDGRINYNNMKYISNNFYKKRLNIEIAKEDILICKDGATTGKVAIIDENFKYKVATINEHLLKLSILDGFDPYYVYAFLNSKYGQTIIKRFISGGAQGGIVQNTMDLIRIPEVSKEIQTYIGEKSKQVNRMKNVLEDKLFKINSEQKQVVEDILMKSEKFDK